MLALTQYCVVCLTNFKLRAAVTATNLYFVNCLWVCFKSLLFLNRWKFNLKIGSYHHYFFYNSMNFHRIVIVNPIAMIWIHYLYLTCVIKTYKVIYFIHLLDISLVLVIVRFATNDLFDSIRLLRSTKWKKKNQKGQPNGCIIWPYFDHEGVIYIVHC